MASRGCSAISLPRRKERQGPELSRVFAGSKPKKARGGLSNRTSPRGCISPRGEMRSLFKVGVALSQPLKYAPGLGTEELFSRS